MDQHIIPECFIDTKLVKVLVPPQIRYNHQHGCSNVEKIMKGKFGDEFALGIIDKDKRVLRYLNECQSVYDQEGFLQLLKHPTKNHYLIVIMPAMERWILNTASVAGLSLNKFDLPDNIDDLCDITKTAKSDKDDINAPKFSRLFREFRQRNPPSVAILTFWINYLKANPYTADLDFIINETNSLLS